MTDEMMSLRTLLEKSSDAELLREMVGFAAQRLMELEVEGVTGAAHGERSPDRLNHRNGYRDRVWETRASAVELASLRSSSRRCWHPRMPARLDVRFTVAEDARRGNPGFNHRGIRGMSAEIGQSLPGIKTP
jgi:Transposase, Mutator family